MWIPRDLKPDEAFFGYEMTPSDESPTASMIYCGSESLDKARLMEIYRRIGAGDYWAWCNVTVTASWGGLKGSYTLHVGTYASRVDFEQHVYPEMKLHALAALNYTVASTSKLLQRLM